MTTPTRWRIVPAEPTREVLTSLRSSTGLSLTPAAKAYAAMLAAAPAPGDEVVDSIIEAVMRANDTPSQRRAVLAALAGET